VQYKKNHQKNRQKNRVLQSALHAQNGEHLKSSYTQNEQMNFTLMHLMLSVRCAPLWVFEIGWLKILWKKKSKSLSSSKCWSSSPSQTIDQDMHVDFHDRWWCLGSAHPHIHSTPSISQAKLIFVALCVLMIPGEKGAQTSLSHTHTNTYIQKHTHTHTHTYSTHIYTHERAHSCAWF